MNFNYKSPDLTDADVAEMTAPKERVKRDYSLVEPGRYLMKVRDIRGRSMGTTGKVKAEITLEHTEKEGAQFATLSLFKSKDNPAADTEVTTKFLVTIGKALGLDAQKLRTISWGAASDAVADQYGNLPAAVLVDDGNGNGEPLTIKDLQLVAIVDVESFQKRDGTSASKNVVKAIYPAE